MTSKNNLGIMLAMWNFLGFCLALLVVVKSVDYAIRYSTRVANHFGLSKHVVGFLIIAGISVLPETVISLMAAATNEPAFALGTLFGSNVADLSLIFGIIILLAPRQLKISSTILYNVRYYTLVLAIPLLLGIDGYYSRVDGLILLLVGFGFHIWVVLRGQVRGDKTHTDYSTSDLFKLIFSLAVLILCSQFTVQFGVGFANDLGIKPVLIGLFLVALGTTLPELLFSLRAVRHNHTGLALGDMMGTVMTDATIVVGLVALLNPFHFPERIIFVTGSFMLVASVLLVYNMKTGRVLSKREGLGLLLFYIAFVLTEVYLNAWIA